MMSKYLISSSLGFVSTISMLLIFATAARSLLYCHKGSLLGILPIGDSLRVLCRQYLCPSHKIVSNSGPRTKTNVYDLQPKTNRGTISRRHHNPNWFCTLTNRRYTPRQSRMRSKYPPKPHRKSSYTRNEPRRPITPQGLLSYHITASFRVLHRPEQPPHHHRPHDLPQVLSVAAAKHTTRHLFICVAYPAERAVRDLSWQYTSYPRSLLLTGWIIHRYKHARSIRR